ncbi:MAG TPA: hypothetical protein VF132_12290 [Rudaea sp.]
MTEAVVHDVMLLMKDHPRIGQVLAEASIKMFERSNVLVMR